MYQGHSVGVVVPAYNEQAFIGEVIDSVPAFVDRLYVVDDCSDDETWDVIVDRAGESAVATESEINGDTTQSLALARTDGSRSDGGRVFENRVIPVRHETNKGRGAAVKTGYKLSLIDGMDVVAVMDGDGQMDPELLDDIVDPIVAGEAEYTKGTRLSDRRHWRQMPKWRLFGNGVLTLLTKIASGYWGMTDPQNGYTAISGEALESYEIADLYEGYGFLNHLLVRLGRENATVADVPIPARYGDESSGIQYRTFVPRLSLLLLQGFLSRLWAKVRPNRLTNR